MSLPIPDPREVACESCQKATSRELQHNCDSPDYCPCSGPHTNTGSTERVKTTITKRIEANYDGSSTFTREDVIDFLNGVPARTRIRPHQSSSYPGERGIEPAYLEASWSE